MKVSREIKTAVLVIISIILFIWGYSFLKGKNLFDNSNKLFVVYENVAGLATSAPVTLNGLTIGKVNSITINPDGKLLVELHITTDFPISKSSIAEIYDSGLVGGRQIAIKPNLLDKNYTVSGDYLQASSKIASLNTTLSEFSVASKNINELLVENKSKFNNTLKNVDKVTGNFAILSDSLAKANLGQTVKNLEKTLAKVDKIMAELEQGKGTMGKLIKDETMYTNFAKTSKELELLLQDVRLHPTRYVNVSLFGKKNKPYVAPINDTIKK